MYFLNVSPLVVAAILVVFILNSRFFSIVLPIHHSLKFHLRNELWQINNPPSVSLRFQTFSPLVNRSNTKSNLALQHPTLLLTNFIKSFIFVVLHFRMESSYKNKNLYEESSFHCINYEELNKWKSFISSKSAVTVVKIWSWK